MGVLSTPLAVPTEDFNNGGNNVEFVPLIHSFHDKYSRGRFDPGAHPRHGHGYGHGQQQIKNRDREGAVRPIRCRYCQAYLNPFVMVERMEFNRALFRCNFCERRNDVNVLLEGNGSKFNVDVGNLPLRHGSVEYEVDGEYIVRDKSSKWGSVHLFALDGSDCEKLHLYLKVLTNAVEEMDEFWKKQKRYTTRVTGVEEIRMAEDALPRIGFFVYLQNHVLIPHWKWKERRKNESNESGWELSVSIMADVKEDPFASLPLASWTYAVGDVNSFQSKNAAPLYKLHELIQQVPSILKEMVPDYKCRGTPKESDSWNCGGAALLIMCHALHAIGGRGTLLTSSRLNYGIGALADRQGNSTIQYAKSSSEEALYTSHQALNTDIGEHFKKLGKLCVQGSVSLSVIMSTPMGYEYGSGVIGTHYVDVATLAELCRHSCGSFKWLRYQELDSYSDENVAFGKNGCYGHQLKEEIL